MNDLSREAQALFRETRHADDPTDTDRQRVQRRLLAQIAMAGAVGMGAIAGAGALQTSRLAAPTLLHRLGVLLLNKFVGLTLAVGTVAGGAAILHGVDGSRASDRAVVAGRSASPSGASAIATNVAPAPVASVAVASAPVEAALALANSAPKVEHPERALSASRAQPGISGARAKGGDDDPSLAAETQLVEQAQRALHSGHPARTLALLDEHARRFPAGALREEGAVARILALCALKREGAARIERDRFVRRWPDSVLINRVANGCEAPGTAHRDP